MYILGSVISHIKLSHHNRCIAKKYLSIQTRNATFPSPTIVFVLGGPGAGKGTQCIKAVNEFNENVNDENYSIKRMHHLSAGQLLRDELAMYKSQQQQKAMHPNTGNKLIEGLSIHSDASSLIKQGDVENVEPSMEMGAIISQYLDRGEIVPIAVTIQLLMKAISIINTSISPGNLNPMQCQPRSVILIDGFPRNEENRMGWNKYHEVNDCNEHEVGSLKNPYVVFFDCTRETLLNRLKTRIQESQANLAAIAGTNDAAHSDKILRSDDNFETIGKRFDVFERDSMPSIEYYRNCCSEKCGNFLAINCNDSVSNIYSNFAAFLRKI